MFYAHPEEPRLHTCPQHTCGISLLSRDSRNPDCTETSESGVLMDVSRYV